MLKSSATSYSKEELIGLMVNAREQMVERLNKDTVNIQTCKLNLETHVRVLAAKFGINKVVMNTTEHFTGAFYEFCKMSNLKKNHSNQKLTEAKYIVIHSTGADDASAETIYKNFNESDRKASAQFIMDAYKCIQSLDVNMVAWAVGHDKNSYGCTNSNSISIEICQYKDTALQQKAIENIKSLLKRFFSNNSQMLKLIKHRDVRATDCPSILTDTDFDPIFGVLNN